MSPVSSPDARYKSGLLAHPIFFNGACSSGTLKHFFNSDLHNSSTSSEQSSNSPVLSVGRGVTWPQPSPSFILPLLSIQISGRDFLKGGELSRPQSFEPVSSPWRTSRRAACQPHHRPSLCH